MSSPACVPPPPSATSVASLPPKGCSPRGCDMQLWIKLVRLGILRSRTCILSRTSGLRTVKSSTLLRLGPSRSHIHAQNMSKLHQRRLQRQPQSTPAHSLLEVSPRELRLVKRAKSSPKERRGRFAAFAIQGFALPKSDIPPRPWQPDMPFLAMHVLKISHIFSCLTKRRWCQKPWRAPASRPGLPQI